MDEETLDDVVSSIIARSKQEGKEFLLFGISRKSIWESGIEALGDKWLEEETRNAWLTDEMCRLRKFVLI